MSHKYDETLYPQEHGQLTKSKYHSTGQISLAALLGGPVAGAYYLSKKYRFFKDDAAASRIMLLTIPATMLMGFVIPFVPENFPNGIFHGAYVMIFGGLAHAYDKEHGIDDKAHKAQKGSTFALVAFSIVVVIITAAVWLATMFGMDHLGLLPEHLST